MIRYGVIGAGMMGVEHIRNINALAGAAVVAVSDPHPESRKNGAAAAAEKNNNGGGGGATADPPQTFAAHQDLLAADLCDAVVIASPNMTHAAVLADALSLPRLHILIEKPLAISVRECRAAIAAARGRTGIVWVGLEYRYMPPAARLLALVAGGAVGKVRMIAAREHRFPFLPKVGDWNRFNQNTGGTMVEKCCHFFDLFNLLAAARPRQIFASGGRDVNHLRESYNGKTPDILDNAFVIADYPECRAVLDLCMFAEATRNQEEISVVGDKGKAEALIPDDIVRLGVRGQDDIGRVREFAVADDSIAHTGLHHGSSYIEHRQFLQAIKTGGAAEVTLEDGLWSVAAGIAAQLSIKQNRPVQMAEVLEE